MIQDTPPSFFFFFNDTATTEIYTLSLHDALPIYYWFKENGGMTRANGQRFRDMILSRGGTMDEAALYRAFRGRDPDRKSTRLNSSHSQISYAVFCLEKKNKRNISASLSPLCSRDYTCGTA